MTTKSGQLTTNVGRPTLADEAARDEMIAGLRDCLDELKEQVAALTAELALSHQDYRDVVLQLDKAREQVRRQADTIADLGDSLLKCQRERRGLEEDLSRLRALEQAAKALWLYVPGAMDEVLDNSDGHFARDAVREALQLAREALADD